MTEGVCVLGGVGGCYPPSHQHIFPHLHFWIKHAPRTYAEIPWWGPAPPKGMTQVPFLKTFSFCVAKKGVIKEDSTQMQELSSSSSRLLSRLRLA